MEFLFSKWSDGSKVYHVVEIIPSIGKFAGKVVGVRYKELDYVESHTPYMSSIISSYDYVIDGKKVNVGGYGLFDMAGNPVQKPELQQYVERLVRAGDF